MVRHNDRCLVARGARPLRLKLEQIFSDLDPENLADLPAKGHDSRYAPGFALECAALARVRNRMGLTNLKVMIPFCRTVDEGKRVIEQMAQHGLRQAENGLEIYAMCEIPANVILADEFLKIFDGYSIGSNDLTQLTLGLDRDSATVAHLFDENNEAVRRMIAHAISSAHKADKPIGICGQAPSDFPEFAEWLVTQGIDSISLNPDTAIKTSLRVARAEQSSTKPAATRRASTAG
jgi:pyruvate,water dikinase